MATSQEQTKPQVQNYIWENAKNAFDTAEVLKTLEIQQCIGFFVIAGLLELFTVYVRPANVRPAMRDC